MRNDEGEGRGGGSIVGTQLRTLFNLFVEELNAPEDDNNKVKVGLYFPLPFAQFRSFTSDLFEIQNLQKVPLSIQYVNIASTQ